MQIRTSCEHGGARTSSATETRLWSCRYARPASTEAQGRRQRRKRDSGHADTHFLRARWRKDVVSDGNETPVMQIRTSCEHGGARTSSATETRLRSCRYAPAVSTEAQGRRQRRKRDSGHADTHVLRARRRKDVVSDGNETLVMQIRTSCEHGGARTSSATETRLRLCRYARPASTVAQGRRQRRKRDSGHADTHQL